MDNEAPWSPAWPPCHAASLCRAEMGHCTCNFQDTEVQSNSATARQPAIQEASRALVWENCSRNMWLSTCHHRPVFCHNFMCMYVGGWGLLQCHTDTVTAAIPGRTSCSSSVLRNQDVYLIARTRFLREASGKSSS